MEVGHKDGVLDLSEEPLQDVCHVLDEVVSDPQFDIPSVFTEVLHQQLDPRFGAVLPVDPLVAQTCKKPRPPALGRSSSVFGINTVTGQ